LSGHDRPRQNRADILNAHKGLRPHRHDTNGHRVEGRPEVSGATREHRGSREQVGSIEWLRARYRLAGAHRMSRESNSARDGESPLALLAPHLAWYRRYFFLPPLGFR
jgi:hypothetical protein